MPPAVASETVSPARLSRRLALPILVLATVIGLLCGVAGAGVGVERTLAEWSAALRRKPASGSLHIVEIDAASIAAIDAWPFPRREYATVVDRLRRAGASVVAFDIDFSTRSTRGGDEAFAAAIDRAAGKVVLPTFSQSAGSRSARTIDALPPEPLRRNAMLAAVSVLPDEDGSIREAPIGTMTAGTPRPSLSAILADRSGHADASFPIDFAIDPQTVPRHSFVDIRDGRFDPAAVRGRRILIGATAIELGDRYAIPGYGVVPGVVIQALAAETLARGVPRRVGWPVGLAVAALLAWLMMRSGRRATLAAAIVGAPVALFLVAVGMQAATGAVAALAPAMILLATASLGTLAARLGRAWRHRRLQDPATGLPNRAALVARLRGDPGAHVVVVRIAGFERLASSLPADASGTLVLRVADRLALVSDGAAIHRVDDRMLAWTVPAVPEEPGERFAALRALMLSPVEVQGRRLDVAVSMGIAPPADADPGRTVANAALAADQAKQDQTGWRVHTEQASQTLDLELSLLGELADAVRNGEMVLRYQPKLDIAGNRITSVEALVRWDHPTRGLLSPDLFIPLAERNDRIEALTLNVLATAIADQQGWAAAGHDIAVAVNLSATLLGSASFNRDLLTLIERTGVRPDRLIFEVTESAAMIEPEAALAALLRFRAIGIAISMDDYGTGQSTLSYLKRLPLTEVKIDRSFVQHADHSRSDAILVRSTVDLAHELGLKVVAEGVETAECLAFLASIGCDLAQGYLVGRPVPAAAIFGMLDSGTARAA